MKQLLDVNLADGGVTYKETLKKLKVIGVGFQKNWDEKLKKCLEVFDYKHVPMPPLPSGQHSFDFISL